MESVLSRSSALDVDKLSSSLVEQKMFHMQLYCSTLGLVPRCHLILTTIACISGLTVYFLLRRTPQSATFHGVVADRQRTMADDVTRCVPDDVIARPHVLFLPYCKPHPLDVTKSHLYVEGRLDSLVKKLDVNCSISVRLGNEEDGGWNVCIAEPFQLTPNSCLVYSFGIGYDFSFDDDVNHKFGCTVRSFDPSLSLGSHRRGVNSWFHNIGLGATNHVNSEGWTLETFSSLLRQFDDANKIIDYVKLDIEGMEWSTLLEMITTKSLHNVKQLAMEIHTTPGRNKRQLSIDHWNVLMELERCGFRRWSYRPNSVAEHLRKRDHLAKITQYEIVFVNKRFVEN